MSQHPLPGGQEHVGGDEAASLGIVVAGLEVVEARLLIVGVAPVAEGIQYAQCGCQGAGAAELLAPAVIRIFYYGIPAAVNQLDYISLPGAQVVVIRPVIVHRLDQASGVIREQQRVAVAVGKAHEHRVVVEVVGGDVPHGLRGPKAVHVVDVAGELAVVDADLLQLFAIPFQGLAPVGRGVAHVIVVDDRLTVIADQLILPFPGGVPIVDRVCGIGRRRRRGVGVDLLVLNVAPRIILIGHRLVGELVVLPDQFVCAVVLVGDGGRPPGDGGYVPVVVVGVFVRVVIAVLVGRDLYLETVNISSNGVVKRTVPLTSDATIMPALNLLACLGGVIKISCIMSSLYHF